MWQGEVFAISDCIISSGFKYDVHVLPHMAIYYVKYGFKRVLDFSQLHIFIISSFNILEISDTDVPEIKNT